MRPGGARDTVGRGDCAADSLVLGEGDAPPGADGVIPMAMPLVVTKPMILAALTADPLGAVYGLPLTVEITLSAGEGDTREEVIGRKRILFTPRLSPEQVPNQNPLVPGLVFRRGDDGSPQVVSLTDPLASPPQVHLGETITVEPSPGTKETYPTRIGDRATGRLSTQTVTEALRYAFFTTEGTFAPAPNQHRTVGDSQPQTNGVESHYHAPRSLLPGASDLVWLWIVVRDERGGQSFVQVAVRLVP